MALKTVAKTLGITASNDPNNPPTNEAKDPNKRAQRTQRTNVLVLWVFYICSIYCAVYAVCYIVYPPSLWVRRQPGGRGIPYSILHIVYCAVYFTAMYTYIWYSMV